jgi:hypothetical protein
MGVGIMLEGEHLQTLDIQDLLNFERTIHHHFEAALIL